MLNDKFLSVLALVMAVSGIALVLVLMGNQAPTKDIGAQASMDHVDSITEHHAKCRASYRHPYDRDAYPRDSDVICLTVHAQIDREVVANAAVYE